MIIPFGGIKHQKAESSSSLISENNEVVTPVLGTESAREALQPDESVEKKEEEEMEAINIEELIDVEVQ